MIPFFSSTFSALTVCNIHFAFENSQNSFSRGPPFGTFWSVKYPNFRQKLLIQIAYHTFLERRHPEVTKSSYYVLPPREARRRYQLVDYRSSRSNPNVLAVVSDRIARAFNRSLGTRAVALDISKAFDRVWDAVLLHKL